MTTKAIDLLYDVYGRRGRDRRGFFLQVEGALIDKQDHVENPCQQIGETIAFDRAIRVGLKFAEKHPDTLVIVTADHAHTSQIVPVPGDEPLGRPGTLSTLMTKGDRSLMTITYATRPHGQSQDHGFASPHRRSRPQGARPRHHEPDGSLSHDRPGSRPGVTDAIHERGDVTGTSLARRRLLPGRARRRADGPQPAATAAGVVM